MQFLSNTITSSEFFGALTLSFKSKSTTLESRIESWNKLEPSCFQDPFFFESLQREIKEYMPTQSEYCRFEDEAQGGVCYFHRSAKIILPMYVAGYCLIGPKSHVGPASYLREGTVIGKKCRVGFTAEIKSSLLLNHVTCSHRSYVGHSIIGEGAIVGAGVIFAARRLDDAAVKIRFPSNPIQTKHAKVGSFVERNTRIPIGGHAMPGKVYFATEIAK